MTKAIDIIRAALQHLRVVDAQAVLNEAETADGLIALNAMMRTWEADGLALGWQDVATSTTEIPTPPVADEAIGYNLAVRLRARFGVAPDADVVALARSGVTMLHALSTSTEYARCNYDDLPVGVGQRSGSWRSGFNC